MVTALVKCIIVGSKIPTTFFQKQPLFLKINGQILIQGALERTLQFMSLKVLSSSFESYPFLCPLSLVTARPVLGCISL
jgi:hypothetical protein